MHIHVRNPQTGKGARDVAYYREVVERLRASGTDVVINLTTGMGGDLVLGGAEQPLPHAAPAPTWPARPSGSRTWPSCARRSARWTAAR